jgi:hypothetical protein
VDGRIILELMLKNYGGKLWTGFIWLRTGPSVWLLNAVMSLRGPIKGGELLESDY